MPEVLDTAGPSAKDGTRPLSKDHLRPTVSAASSKVEQPEDDPWLVPTRETREDLIDSIRDNELRQGEYTALRDGCIRDGESSCART